MFKRIITPAVIAFALAFASAATAANCPSFPYILTNGQAADANQVMANFNSLLMCSNTALASSGVNSSITQITGLTTPLSVAQGGTGSATAVTTFNLRSGAVALTSGDVTAALGYTPPSAPVLSFNARSGAVVLTSGDVTAALTYAPVNPASPVLTAAPIFPTPLSSDNSTKGATTAYVTAAITSVGFPSGAIVAYAANSYPGGWLVCNGSAVSRSVYASLFAAIGTTYGGGDGSTTFNIPNLLGRFLRGYDSSNAVDPGRVFASTQADQMQGHNHGPASGNFSVVGTATGSSVYTGNNNPNLTTSTATGGPVSDGVNGTPRIGAETRPTNVAMNYIIKI